MDNKKLGIILIVFSLLMLILLGIIRTNVISAYQAEIDSYLLAGEACPSDPELCPHEQRSRSQTPIYITGVFLFGIMALGVYLIFFEKSQKEIVSALGKQKEMKIEEEKFEILLKGMDADERKVIKAVKEQDGITQQTLRLRTDMHKSKLSIVLDGLEKKNLIKRTVKGKTKQVYLRLKL
jgi:hypothetical protein